MARPVHLIADCEADAAAAVETLDQLGLAVPDAELRLELVAPGDTLAAGFLVARRVLRAAAEAAAGSGVAGAGTDFGAGATGAGAGLGAPVVIAHDVAPGEDEPGRWPTDRVEHFYCSHAPGDTIVVGANVGWTWSFALPWIGELHCIDVHPGDPARRPRAGLPAAVGHAVRRHSHANTASITHDAVPRPPAHTIAYVEAGGNIATTLTALPAPAGARLLVRIGRESAPAVVAGERPAGDWAAGAAGAGSSDAVGAVAGARGARAEPVPVREGELALQRTPLGVELAQRGGSAHERFASPAPGTPIAFAPLSTPPVGL